MIYDIPKGIKEARIAHHHTQKELADLLKISNETIFNYESGKTTPDMLVLVNMAQLYNCSVDNLIKFNKYINIGEPSNKQEIFDEFRTSYIFNNADDDTQISLNKCLQVYELLKNIFKD